MEVTRGSSLPSVILIPEAVGTLLVPTYITAIKVGSHAREEYLLSCLRVFVIAAAISL